LKYPDETEKPQVGNRRVWQRLKEQARIDGGDDQYQNLPNFSAGTGRPEGYLRSNHMVDYSSVVAATLGHHQDRAVCHEQF